jgi:hypothetical protein
VLLRRVVDHAGLRYRLGSIESPASLAPDFHATSPVHARAIDSQGNRRCRPARLPLCMCRPARQHCACIAGRSIQLQSEIRIAPELANLFQPDLRHYFSHCHRLGHGHRGHCPYGGLGRSRSHRRCHCHFGRARRAGRKRRSNGQVGLAARVAHLRFRRSPAPACSRSVCDQRPAVHPTHEHRSRVHLHLAGTAGRTHHRRSLVAGALAQSARLGSGGTRRGGHFAHHHLGTHEPVELLRAKHTLLALGFTSAQLSLLGDEAKRGGNFQLDRRSVRYLELALGACFAFWATAGLLAVSAKQTHSEE